MATNLKRKENFGMPIAKKRKIDDNDNDNDNEEQKQCKFGCGRSVAPGTTKNNNAFDTCCRNCAVLKGKNVTNHDIVCDERNKVNVNDIDMMDVDKNENNQSSSNASGIGEIYEGEDDRFVTSIVNEIMYKNNWQKKIENKEILSKWLKECKNYGLKKEEEFNTAIDILKSMKNRMNLNKKIKSNKYYDKSDDDSEYIDRPLNYGVLVEDNINHSFIPKELHKKFKEYINNEIELKLSENEKDWHPGSNQQVLDLVHPSLFCYVENRSDVNLDILRNNYPLLYKQYQNTEEKYKKNNDPSNKQQQYWFDSFSKNKKLKKDNTRYQWLPAEFEVITNNNNNNNNNKNKNDIAVNINSYINNLDRLKHKALYDMISEIFVYFIPMINKVLNIDSFQSINNRYQVIVKLANIILAPDNNNNKAVEYEGGVWHLEGMEYEHIAATGIFYYEMNNIQNSFLEFRQSISDEVDYAQDDHAGVWENYQMLNGQELNEYLGRIKIENGKCICFPNEYQHRVTKFKLMDNKSVGVRKILVFFIIDPKERILSTMNVPIQSKTIMGNYLHGLLDKEFLSNMVDIILEYLPLMTLKEAKEFREKLMFQRKYYINEQNEEIYEREFSLCEH